MDKQQQLDQLIANPDSFPVSTPQDNLLSEEQMLALSRQNEHHRNEDWQAFFYQHFKWFFRGLCVIFGIILIILLWHWIAPITWQWLTPHQLDNLKNILLAVFASNVVANWVSKIR